MYMYLHNALLFDTIFVNLIRHVAPPAVGLTAKLKLFLTLLR